MPRAENRPPPPSETPRFRGRHSARVTEPILQTGTMTFVFRSWREPPVGTATEWLSDD
jgi:hypothetical protein